jgi:hypothetical protein
VNGAGDHGEAGVEVRAVQPFQAVKTYRCPGCHGEIPPGTGHVVVVPVAAPEERRHWHRSCWTWRAERAPRVPRRRPWVR